MGAGFAQYGSGDVKSGVQGPPRLLNHSRFPDGRAHGFAAPLRVALGLRPKCPGCSIIRASLTVALMVSLPRFGSLCASRKCPPGTRFPSRHRAHASLRACRGLGQTPGRSIFAEGADRAHRSFRSPPSGRFATFGGKCPQGTRFPSVPQVLCRSTECKRFERPEVARNADGCSLYVFDLNLWRAGRVPKGTRRAAVAGRDGRARPAGRDSPEGAGARRWLDAQACGGGSRPDGPVAGGGGFRAMGRRAAGWFAARGVRRRLPA